MLFNYELRNQKGKKIKGQIEANNLYEARNRLALKDDMLVSLKPVKKKDKKSLNFTFGRLKLLDKVLLTKHLSVMIKSGMGIDMALETIIGHAKSNLSKRLKDILKDVRKGVSLSNSLKKYPRDFDNLFVNMVSVGESGGTLAENLNLLSKQQRKSYELKNKIRSASIYPVLILSAIVILTLTVSKFVLPKIIKFFTQLKVELPLSTKILLFVADFMGNQWYLMVGIIISFIIIIRIMLHFSKTRLFLHKINLRLPLFGKIIRNINLILFTRTLASLLKSGLSIDKALQITAKTVTNDSYKEEITFIYHNILKGQSLTDSLRSEKKFPPLVGRMITVGERSGNLEEVLDYLADFYEEEVDDTTKNLSTVLEPALLIIIGLAVGFVALSIINPIYQLTSQVGR